MNTVILSDEQSVLEFKKEYEEIIKKAVDMTAEDRGESDIEVSVLITDNDGIREINREYRNIDSETDVLSFPMRDYDDDQNIIDDGGECEEKLLGDIVISLEKALEQGDLYGHGILREIGFLTVHSMLHLYGFDHIEEEERGVMREKEEEILKKMNLSVE